MNKTTNYNLNQWEAGDRVLRTDFNSDNAKIDAALTALEANKADVSALEALSQTVNGKGNCVLKTGSYTGTGSNSKTLTLGSALPKLLIIVGGAHHAVFIPQSEHSSSLGSTYGRSMSVTWATDSLTWSSTHSTDGSEALNESGTTYVYFAFY